jgi:hypothetical protein
MSHLGCSFVTDKQPRGWLRLLSKRPRAARGAGNEARRGEKLIFVPCQLLVCVNRQWPPALQLPSLELKLPITYCLVSAVSSGEYCSWEFGTGLFPSTPA